MKRVLFIITYLDCGGICRSLQNFLNLNDESKCEVDVFSMVHHGLFEDQLDKCNLLPKSRFIEALMARYSDQSKRGKMRSACMKILNRISNNKIKYYLFKIVSSKLVHRKQYDAVIAYSEGVPTTFVSFMDHANKIAWIHCDYLKYYEANGNKSELSLYDKFNSIVNVSEYTKRSFDSIYPSLIGKSYVVYNILDDLMIKKLSILPVDDMIDNTIFNIVSIGRTDPVKQYSKIPSILSDIIKAGIDNIHWYIIGPKSGYPEEYELLISNIEKYKVEEKISLLGERSNPYPYISSADVLVCTSKSEACPYVINEAKIIGTPVVCTNFGSSSEFVENNNNGLIVPIEQMSEAIISLITNKELYNRIRTNSGSFIYDNNAIINRIYSLIA